MKTKLLKKLRKQAKEAYWVKKRDNGRYTVEGYIPDFGNYSLEDAIRICDIDRRNYVIIKLRYVNGYDKKQYDRVY